MTHQPQPLLLPTPPNLALAALWTYRSPSLPLCLPRPIRVIEAGSLLADIYRAPGNGVVIAVRGTAALSNWAYNVNARWRGSDYLPGRIHAGFAAASIQVTLPLRKWLVSSDLLNRDRANGLRQRVWLCGHSLGGAVAMFLAPWFAQRGIEVMGVHTYGAPRVGDGEYVRAWNRGHGRRHWRNVNCVDPVAHLPPWISGYRHVAGLEYWDRSGRPFSGGGSSVVALFDQLLAGARALVTPGTMVVDYHDMAAYVALVTGDCREAQRDTEHQHELG